MADGAGEAAAAADDSANRHIVLEKSTEVVGDACARYFFFESSTKIAGKLCINQESFQGHCHVSLIMLSLFVVIFFHMCLNFWANNFGIFSP